MIEVTHGKKSINGGLFARISDETDLSNYTNVSPDSVQHLIEKAVVFFCTGCGCFHQEEDVSWDELLREIKAIAN